MPSSIRILPRISPVLIWAVEQASFRCRIALAKPILASNSRLYGHGGRLIDLFVTGPPNINDATLKARPNLLRFTLCSVPDARIRSRSGGDSDRLTPYRFNRTQLRFVP